MAERGSMVGDITDGLRRSPLARLLALGMLVVALLVPIGWISDLISERAEHRSAAERDIAAIRGGAQTLVGPALLVPYEHHWTDTDGNGRSIDKHTTQLLTVLPRALRIQARVDTDVRARGIFSLAVYRSQLEISGSFEMPDVVALAVDPQTIDWRHSQLAVGLTDARAIRNAAVLRWDGAETALQPGAGLLDVCSGIHAVVAQPFAAAAPAFALTLTVDGTGGLFFTPAGQETLVSVESNWPSPSFQGSWSPERPEGSAAAFPAVWTIPQLARDQTQAWTSQSSTTIEHLEKLCFGVNLVDPVDAHRMASRSVKYAELFIVMTFTVVWLIEVLTGQRVHPIQYLLIGCALCVFFLLELSLAEHIGFTLAYVLASGAVVGLVAYYSAVILRGWRRAAGVVATVASLYCYLYILLTNEDDALLFGSIGVFVALATTMLLTRHIDWYAAGVRAPAGLPPDDREGAA